MKTRNDKSIDQDFISVINSISAELEGHVDLVGDEVICQFTDKAKRIASSISEIKREGRQLKIGIIGCVKAGKSSFLNALVFDGCQILPKAPTPMTAALTKISYGTTPEARIVFYQPYDWKNIESMDDKYEARVDEAFKKAIDKYNQRVQALSNSAGYGYSSYVSVEPRPARQEIEKCLQLPENLVASHELVTMVKERHISPNEYLGKEEVITGDPCESTADYISKLEQYVGADGKLTPLVNHIELVINNPLLDGFVIIDTPGLNDPIVSRGKATKEYLMNCDVVFVVSSVSQFLTSQDIALISKNLSQESISHAYVIGSKLDDGLLQYDRFERSLQSAWNGSLDAYEAQAQRELEKLAQHDSSPLITRLRESLPPAFVSAMMYGIAKKMEDNLPLDAEEQHVVDNLQRHFSDYQEHLSTPDAIYDFSGIEGVKERVYDYVRKEKSAIISEKVSQYTASQTADLLRLLETINIASKSNLENLRTGDVERLESKVKHLNQKLDSIRYQVSNIFTNQAVACRQQIQAIKIEIAKEASLHSEIEIETRKERVKTESRYGLFGMMRRTDVYMVEKKTARASEAVGNVLRYGTEAQRLINTSLHRLFDIEGLKSKIKSCVIGAFDLADKEFNPDEILIPLETMLMKLTVDTVNFKFIDETENKIYGEFSSNDDIVEGNNIHRLYRLQEEEISRVLQCCSTRLDQISENIESEMKTQSGIFVDGIINRVSENIELMKKLLAHREDNIDRYEEFIDAILRYKKELFPFQE